MRLIFLQFETNTFYNLRQIHPVKASITIPRPHLGRQLLTGHPAGWSWSSSQPSSHPGNPCHKTGASSLSPPSSCHSSLSLKKCLFPQMRLYSSYTCPPYRPLLLVSLPARVFGQIVSCFLLLIIKATIMRSRIIINTIVASWWSTCSSRQAGSWQPSFFSSPFNQTLIWANLGQNLQVGKAFNFQTNFKLNALTGRLPDLLPIQLNLKLNF